jgi:multidrug efflux system outer membrane protein
MMKRFLLLLTIALLAAGCAIGPDYKRPEIDVPQAYRYGNGEGKTDAADSEWWKQFNDPILDKYIAEALANNKNVKIAAANVERAGGALMTTRSALFPQISYNGSAERTQISKNNLTVPTQNPYNNYQALGGASWEIDLWGRLRRLTESARPVCTQPWRRGAGSSCRLPPRWPPRTSNSGP